MKYSTHIWKSRLIKIKYQITIKRGRRNDRLFVSTIETVLTQCKYEMYVLWKLWRPLDHWKQCRTLFPFYSKAFLTSCNSIPHLIIGIKSNEGSRWRLRNWNVVRKIEKSLISNITLLQYWKLLTSFPQMVN